MFDIVGWFLSGLGVITPFLSHLFKRLWVFFKVEKPIRVFYGKLYEGSAVIILPPEDVDEERKGTQFHDWHGAVEIKDFLMNRGIKVEIVNTEELSEEQKRKNIISVGGPIPNKISRKLLEEDGIVYSFGGSDKHAIVNFITKETEIDPKLVLGHDKVTQDFGIISRIQNPYNRRTDAIILAGILGWGTHSASKLIIDLKSLTYINGKSHYFQVLCGCKLDEYERMMEPYLLDLSPYSEGKDTIVKIGG